MTRDEFRASYASHLRSIIASLKAAKTACEGAALDPNCPDEAEDSIREHAAQCERYLELFENEFLPKFERLEQKTRQRGTLQ